MPTNAATLAQLAADAQYEKESLAQIVAYIKKEIGGRLEAGNEILTVFRGSVTALAAGGEIRTNGGVKIYAVHIQSPAAATQDVVARFFNTSTGSTALTTTAYGTSKDALSLPCQATKSKTFFMLPAGLEFQTAASYAVVTQAALDTAANATAAPVVTVVYGNI